MDKTKLNISKCKNLPVTTKIINRNKKTKIQRNDNTKKLWTIYHLQLLKELIEKLHCFSNIFHAQKKNASQLFCTGNIESIDEAIKIYEKYNKEIPICTSTDILRTLPKLKANLQKFKKYLISIFYLFTKFYRGKKVQKKKTSEF